MKREPDFSQPLGFNYVVALKTKDGKFGLYVERFFKKAGKSYMGHTTNIAEAKRFSRIIADEVCDEVREYRCVGKVFHVSYDNSVLTPVEKLG